MGEGMIIRVCSGFSPAGQKSYGDRFLRTFDRHWPAEIELQVWVEEPTPMPRDAYRDLWAIPGAKEFHVEHGSRPVAMGRVPGPRWKERERQAGYCFRFDAAKFWKQILIPQAASKGLQDGDVLIWLDADVETFAPIGRLDVLALLPGDAQVSYLARPPKHSEIGFWAVRIDPTIRDFLALMAWIYTGGEVFDLPEWHSAYVWDRARERVGLREHSLCRIGARGHVFPTSPLGRWLRHDKGGRKPR